VFRQQPHGFAYFRHFEHNFNCFPDCIELRFTLERQMKMTDNLAVCVSAEAVVHRCLNIAGLSRVLCDVKALFKNYRDGFGKGRYFEILIILLMFYSIFNIM
jgi:hypothetical protein